MPLVRKRANGFGEDAKGFDEDGNFAALGAGDFAGGFDDIAEVQEIKFGKADVPLSCFFGFDGLFAEEKLDAPGLILNVAKGEAALLAPRNEATGDGDFMAVESFEIVDQFFGVVTAAAFGGIWLKSLLPHCGSFVNADVSDFVEWIRHSVLFLPERATLAKSRLEGKRQTRGILSGLHPGLYGQSLSREPLPA